MADAGRRVASATASARGVSATHARLIPDARRRRACHAPRVTYAVVWNDETGTSFAGKLELIEGCVVLSGRGPEGSEGERRLPVSELTDVHVGQLSRAQAAASRGLVLVGGDGKRLEIASLEGVGALHELAEGIAWARGAAAA